MKKHLNKVVALCSATALLSIASVFPIHADEVRTDTMFRLYNPNSGEHFYTSDSEEQIALLLCGWKDEGIGWIAPEKSNTPVYRLYNRNAGDHHYTANESEKNELVKKGWKDEGIGWYSDDLKSVPLYREYNPNAKAGSHNYTTNQDEHQNLVRVGWKDEGIGWYAMGSGHPLTPGHFEQVWVEGKTEQVPITKDIVHWYCSRCGYECNNSEGQRDHTYEHWIKDEASSFYSSHEKVIIGYETKEIPGHYEWQWIDD